jgi:large subunit ribosomal protein L24
MKLKKNDTVVIIAGKDKGKSGKIIKIDHKRERVIVQGANMVKKAMKKQSQQDRGGIMEIEAPIHVSNVMYLTSKGEASRIGYKFDDKGTKVRFAKKTGEEI